MVQQAYKNKSRVIRGTPMYSLGNKIALGVAGTFCAAHAGIWAYTFLVSDLDERYPKLFRGGPYQVLEGVDSDILLIQTQRKLFPVQEAVDAVKESPTGKTVNFVIEYFSKYFSKYFSQKDISQTVPTSSTSSTSNTEAAAVTKSSSSSSSQETPTK